MKRAHRWDAVAWEMRRLQGSFHRQWVWGLLTAPGTQGKHVGVRLGLPEQRQQVYALQKGCHRAPARGHPQNVPAYFSHLCCISELENEL